MFCPDLNPPNDAAKEGDDPADARRNTRTEKSLKDFRPILRRLRQADKR
jgi:hypothetical protein